jgi:hypothetical protein
MSFKIWTKLNRDDKSHNETLVLMIPHSRSSLIHFSLLTIHLGIKFPPFKIFPCFSLLENKWESKEWRYQVFEGFKIGHHQLRRDVLYEGQSKSSRNSLTSTVELVPPGQSVTGHFYVQGLQRKMPDKWQAEVVVSASR